MEDFIKEVDSIENALNMDMKPTDVLDNWKSITPSLINPFELKFMGEKMLSEQQYNRCLILASYAAIAFLNSGKEPNTVYTQVEQCAKIIKDLFDKTQFRENKKLAEDFALPILKHIIDQVSRRGNSDIHQHLQKECMIWCFIHLGCAYHLQDNFEYAKIEIKKALRLADGGSEIFQRMPRLQAAIYHNLAAAEYRLQNWTESLNAYEKAKDFYTSAAYNTDEITRVIERSIENCNKKINEQTTT